MTPTQTETLLADIARIEATLPADHVEAARQAVSWAGIETARATEVEAYAAELRLCETEAINKVRSVVFMRAGRAASEATKGQDYPTIKALAIRLCEGGSQGVGLMTSVAW